MSIHRTKELSLDSKHAYVNPIPYPSVLPPPSPPPLDPWTRNPSWLTLPAVTDSEEKIVGLYQILDGANFIAFTAYGDYTVDWGDGSPTENISSGVTASHQYDYSNVNLDGTNAPVTFDEIGNTVNRLSHGYVNDDTVSFATIMITTGIVSTQTYYVINATTNTFQLSLTKNGTAITLTNNGSGTILYYKQAIVTITPQIGSQLTTINLDEKYTYTPTLNSYSAGWLDIALSMPNMTISGLTIGQTSNINKGLLEQINFVNLGNLGSTSNLFGGCYGLRSVIFPTTNNVTDMSYTFSGSNISSIIFPSGALSNVTNMANMFLQCRRLQTVILPDTSSLTNTSGMFSNCSILESVTFTDLSNVTNVYNMFDSSGIQICTLPNMSSLTDCYNMFRSCIYLQSVTISDLSAVTSMSEMFYYCPSLQELNFPSLPSLTDTSFMFDSSSITYAPYFDTSSVTTMNGMFNGCENLKTIPLYDTTNVQSMSYMFSECYALETIPLINTSSVTDFSNMFSYCYSLKTGPLLDMSSASSTYAMFYNCSGLTNIPPFDLSLVSNTSLMFSRCYSLQSITFTTSPGQDISNMFDECYSLKKVTFFDMSTVTNCNSLFSRCYSLQDVQFPETIPNVTNVSNMFSYCLSFKSSFTLPNLPSVTNLVEMFNNSGIESVTINDISSWTSLRAIFSNSNIKEVNLPNTSGITDMAGMFNNCKQLISAPYMDTSSVTDMYKMFYGCKALKEVPLYNTSNVTKFSAMFGGCTTLQTIPTFDTSSGTSFVSMFYGIPSYYYYPGTPNYSLTVVPKLNLQNATVNYNDAYNWSNDYSYWIGFNNTSTGLVAMVSGNSLTEFLPYNIKVGISFYGQKLSKAALETVFDNLAIPYNPSDSTITITGNPGADTPINKTATTTLGSTTISIANTSSLETGMLVTGTGIAISSPYGPSAAGDVSTDAFTLNGHGLSNNTMISFSGGGGTISNIASKTIYYVVNADANTFQISTTLGGSAMDLTGSNASLTIIYPSYISAINPNVSVTITTPAGSNSVGTTLSFRKLDISKALMKGWTITI